MVPIPPEKISLGYRTSKRFITFLKKFYTYLKVLERLFTASGFLKEIGKENRGSFLSLLAPGKI